MYSRFGYINNWPYGNLFAIKLYMDWLKVLSIRLVIVNMFEQNFAKKIVKTVHNLFSPKLKQDQIFGPLDMKREQKIMSQSN